jgi:Protein of unknown function (DUF1194)
MLNVGAALSLMLLSGFPVCAQADEPWRKKVDLELVLAVDASGSVSLELSRDQRQGFAAAFRDPDLQRALLSGPLGTVAVVYFEWAGSANQRLVVPWTLLSTTREIAAFADLLVDVELHASGGGTSISGAMQFSRYLLASNNYDGLREVVDIAANGKNTEGTPVGDSLQALRASGAVVNVLILPARTFVEEGPYVRLFRTDDEPLDAYFRNHVIGGPGSFVMAVDSETGFADAILKKLVLEVAWSTQQVRD